MNYIVQILSCALCLSFITTASAAGTLGHGASCNTRKFSPKFRAVDDTCDESRGLFCIDSEHPEFTPKGKSATICDCQEDYYFDSNTNECRIQVGLQCDPDKANSADESWNNKCPTNGYCSTNLGRYGPKGARGMCRCNDGFLIKSVWFVGGGGTTCEEYKSDKEGMSPDYADNRLGF